MADLLTLAEARAALTLPASDTSKDADLSNIYIPAVTPVVEDLTGPLMQRTVTHTVDGGKTFIVLPSRPTSVTSVTETGVSLVANVDYTVNTRAGIVVRGSTRTPYIFLPGQSNVVVTYVAGPYVNTADVPAQIKLAARIIVAQLWQADQQGFRPQFGQPDQSLVTTPSGFAVPRRAYELLRPSFAVPGFA